MKKSMFHASMNQFWYVVRGNCTCPSRAMCCRLFYVLCAGVICVAFANDDFMFPNSEESDGQNSCTTPNRSPGSCITIGNCQYLLDILKNAPKPIPAYLVKQLRDYMCGFDGNTPKVCCPSSSTSIPGRFTDNVDTPEDISNHRNLHLINDENCGFVEIPDRIYNGNETEPFEFKFAILISYRIRGGLAFRCGGSLINDNYILTAAHCITQLSSGLTIAGVRLGEHNILTTEDCDSLGVCAPPVQDVAVRELIPHPQYNALTYENDIGLIRLASPARTDLDHIKSICLPRGNLQRALFPRNSNLTVAGWGQTETGSASSVLLKADLPYISLEDCQKIYNSPSLFPKGGRSITSRQLCFRGQNSDSCGGDSGGPLFKTYSDQDVFPGRDTTDSRNVQHGVISFGPKDCSGTTGLPGVYTNVGYYMKWILDNIKP